MGYGYLSALFFDLMLIGIQMNNGLVFPVGNDTTPTLGTACSGRIIERDALWQRRRIQARPRGVTKPMALWRRSWLYERTNVVTRSRALLRLSKACRV